MSKEVEADLLSDIPPVGSRRISIKMSKALVFAGKIVGVATPCLYFLWLIRFEDAIGWWVIRLLLIGLPILSVAFLLRRLTRERRLLETGTALTARVTEIDAPEGDESLPRPNVHYEFIDSTGQVCRATTYDSTEFEEGSLLTVFCEPGNPKNHIPLRKSFYKVLKQAAPLPPDLDR